MNNKTKLIEYLGAKNGWALSEELASYLGVTNRTIRNYVNKINSVSSSLIISSKFGYSLNTENYNQNILYEDLLEENNKRFFHVLVDLLKSKPINDVYDLAEKYFISESTLNNDFQKIRILLDKYHLKLKISTNEITIIGSEKEKRKLINYLINIDSYEYFNSMNILSLLFDGYNILDIRKYIFEACVRENLFVNDYGLNNILIHIIILVERSKNKYYSEEELTTEYEQVWEIHENYFRCAQSICQSISELLNTTIKNNEVNQIALMIFVNSNQIDFRNIDNQRLNTTLGGNYLEIITKTMNEVTDYYNIDRFDDVFFLKFTLHVYNLIKRSDYQINYYNPLTKLMKSEYPLIYDISVRFISKLNETFDISINEDEISFIAFHIGAYFEDKVTLDKKFNIAYFNDNYYDFDSIVVSKLSRYFSSVANVFSFSSAETLMSDLKTIDLVLTSKKDHLNLPAGKSIIHISPFLTEKELRNIEVKVSNLLTIQNKNEVIRNLKHFINPSLFKKNYYQDNKFSIITDLCSEAIQLGLITEEFRDSVIQRESLSSTAFAKHLAMPHSLSVNALKSFMFVVVNEEPIMWDDKEVRIIILIGVHEADYTSFRFLFDLIVKSIDLTENIDLLLSSTDYEQFVSNLASIIQ